MRVKVRDLIPGDIVVVGYGSQLMYMIIDVKKSKYSNDVITIDVLYNDGKYEVGHTWMHWYDFENVIRC